jgi:hypothetical protein
MSICNWCAVVGINKPIIYVFILLIFAENKTNIFTESRKLLRICGLV